ncbi:hypothetical protein [Sphingorhabdus sp. YGSMI21]|uniref:hypothetical protein n=1 Tax=Sphingorhabdus sp. YGSMI21 TaxID=2077182 RepID=UPI000F503DBB|nr:hypothetical protein [Sphingorhabdus sp. YGSMI21]
MTFQNLLISQLLVNPANDRHGELRDESAAIDELFRSHDVRMRALARDVVAESRIFDPPLVMLHDERYVVFDGNRRVTCMKLLREPDRAPTDELIQFFRQLRDQWDGRFPSRMACQVENDRETIDDILFRRHTGTQGGVGQIGWDNRAKTNFVERTGRDGPVNVGAAVEELLTEEELLPEERIPWSTLSRLLSSEQFRNRAGISILGREFRLTHERGPVLRGLQRIAEDLGSGPIK